MLYSFYFYNNYYIITETEQLMSENLEKLDTQIKELKEWKETLEEEVTFEEFLNEIYEYRKRKNEIENLIEELEKQLAGQQQDELEKQLQEKINEAQQLFNILKTQYRFTDKPTPAKRKLTKTYMENMSKTKNPNIIYITTQPQNNESVNTESNISYLTEQQPQNNESENMYQPLLSESVNTYKSFPSSDENTISSKFHDIGKSILNLFIGFGTLIAQHKVISIIILFIILVIVAIVLCCVLIPKYKNKQNNTEDKQNNEQYL